MVKVGAIIQARLGSERLPNKALLPLPFSGGPSILEHVVFRAKAATGIDEVIVATTEKVTDNAISDFCGQNDIIYYRGSENDVLDRFYKAAVHSNLDVIIRLTADNPFISPETIEKAVQQHVAAGVDYTITEGLPLGTNIEVISFTGLERAANVATELADREHVTPYIRRENNFKKQTVSFDSPIRDLRLTVDYPSDYALASLIYDKLFTEGKSFDLEAIQGLLLLQPWLKSVNESNTQRAAFSSETEEYQEATKMLKKGGFTRTLEKLKEVLK